MKFLRQQRKPQINNSLYSSTFKMNLCIDEESQQIMCKNVINLLKDLFPYLQPYSLTTLFILIQLAMNLLINRQSFSIKPYFILSQIIPWILCPFACSSNSYMFCHILFMLMIGSQLQKVLKKPTKYAIIYFTFSISANLVSKILFINAYSILITNQSTFALYIYLHLIKNQNNLPQYELDVQNFHQDNSDSKVQSVYKSIFFSYVIYAATYGLQGTHYSIYIIGVIISVLFSFIF